MEFAKITAAGKDTRIHVGYTYQLERLDSGYLRLSSIGGKYSCLINPDTTAVEFEIVTEPTGTPLKGWRNSYAADLWVKVYADTLSDIDDHRQAAADADLAVAAFKERWEGTTFLHQGAQDA